MGGLRTFVRLLDDIFHTYAIRPLKNKKDRIQMCHMDYSDALDNAHS